MNIWSTNTYYGPGILVIGSDNNLYRSLSKNIGLDPTTHSDIWQAESSEGTPITPSGGGGIVPVSLLGATGPSVDSPTGPSGFLNPFVWSHTPGLTVGSDLALSADGTSVDIYTKGAYIVTVEIEPDNTTSPVGTLEVQVFATSSLINSLAKYCQLFTEFTLNAPTRLGPYCYTTPPLDLQTGDSISIYVLWNLTSGTTTLFNGASTMGVRRVL